MNVGSQGLGGCEMSDQRTNSTMRYEAEVDVDGTLFLSAGPKPGSTERRYVPNWPLLNALSRAKLFATSTFSTVDMMQAHTVGGRYAGNQHLKKGVSRLDAASLMMCATPEAYQGLTASASLLESSSTAYGRRIHGQEVLLSKLYDDVDTLSVSHSLQPHVSHDITINDIPKLLIEDLFVRRIIYLVIKRIERIKLSDESPIQTTRGVVCNLFSATSSAITYDDLFDSDEIMRGWVRNYSTIHQSLDLAPTQVDGVLTDTEQHRAISQEIRTELKHYRSEPRSFLNAVSDTQQIDQSASYTSDLFSRLVGLGDFYKNLTFDESIDYPIQLFMAGKGPMLFHRIMDAKKALVAHSTHPTIMKFIFDDRNEVIQLTKQLMRNENREQLGRIQLKAIQVMPDALNSADVYHALMYCDDAVDSLTRKEISGKLWELSRRRLLDRPIRLNNGIVLTNAVASDDVALPELLKPESMGIFSDNRIIPIAHAGQYYLLFYHGFDQRFYFVAEHADQELPALIKEQLSNRYNGRLIATDELRINQPPIIRLLNMQVDDRHAYMQFHKANVDTGMSRFIYHVDNHKNTLLISRSLKGVLSAPHQLRSPAKDAVKLPIRLHNASNLESLLRHEEPYGHFALIPVVYGQRYMPIVFNPHDRSYYVLSGVNDNDAFKTACHDLLGIRFGGFLKFSDCPENISFTQAAVNLAAYFDRQHMDQGIKLFHSNDDAVSWYQQARYCEQFDIQYTQKLNATWDRLFNVIRPKMPRSTQWRSYIGLPDRNQSSIDTVFDWIGYALGGFLLRPMLTLLKLPTQMLLYGFEGMFETIKDRVAARRPVTLLGQFRRGLGVGIFGILQMAFKVPRVFVQAVMSPIQSFQAASTVHNPILRTYARMITGLLAVPYAVLLPFSMPYFPKAMRSMARAYQWLFTSSPSIFDDRSAPLRRNVVTDPIDQACVSAAFHRLNGRQAEPSKMGKDCLSVHVETSTEPEHAASTAPSTGAAQVTTTGMQQGRARESDSASGWRSLPCSGALFAHGGRAESGGQFAKRDSDNEHLRKTI